MNRDVKIVVAMCVWVLALCAASLLGLGTAHGRSSPAPAQIIDHVMTWTPTWYPEGKGPETATDRQGRWTMITEVAWFQSDAHEAPWWTADKAALVLATWKFESALDYHVHGGEPSPIGDSDNGSSRCLGQIQHVKAWWTEEKWKALAGRSRAATQRCAEATLRVFWYHAERCKLRRDLRPAARWRGMLSREEVAILMAAYADGVSCEPKAWLEKRLNEWESLRAAGLESA